LTFIFYLFSSRRWQNNPILPSELVVTGDAGDPAETKKPTFVLDPPNTATPTTPPLPDFDTNIAEARSTCVVSPPLRLWGCIDPPACTARNDAVTSGRNILCNQKKHLFLKKIGLVSLKMKRKK
jgi:hypothetical protein